MPVLPNLHDLPPQSLARLRALNPELMDELRPAEPQQEANPLWLLETRMKVAQEVALSGLWELAAHQVPAPRVVAVKDDKVGLIFRYAFATLAFVYVAAIAGAFG